MNKKATKVCDAVIAATTSAQLAPNELSISQRGSNLSAILERENTAQ